MASNSSAESGLVPTMSWDDATWILTSSFIIFTMQSGFGLLEAGNVSSRNEVNIMVKNVMDVIFGGLSYWMFGFGLSFGMAKGSNPFCGVGHFFVDVAAKDSEKMGVLFSTFVFQLSFATTATTIVSGAMAERTKLTAYIIFSFFNTLVYCVPAHWVWGDNGFLRQIGSVDFAGSGVVHLVGGTSGLVGTLLLKPRIGRFTPDEGGIRPSMSNPANAVMGMFMIWWGWLAFNCGSTFGISNGRWKLAAKAAVTTLLASMSGGLMGTVISYFGRKKMFEISYLVNAILGALVSITASCALVHAWESIIIGGIGGILTICTDELLNKLKIDDPVSAVAVHGTGGLWGMFAAGFFVSEDRLEHLTRANGLFHGGGFRLLGVQTLAIVCETAWSGIVTFLLLYVINRIMGLRVSEEEERLGADIVEHGIKVGDSTSHMIFSSHNEQPHKTSPTISKLVSSINTPLRHHKVEEKKPRNGIMTLTAVEGLDEDTSAFRRRAVQNSEPEKPNFFNNVSKVYAL